MPGHAVAAQPDFKTLMRDIWAAWEQGPDAAAKFYSKEPSRIFFDIAPLEYKGWTKYEEGSRKMLGEYARVQFKVDPDAQSFQQGSDFAWGFATLHATLTRKSGSKEDMLLRWTVLWEKQGDDWLIVHEHVSAPAVPPPAGRKSPGE